MDLDDDALEFMTHTMQKFTDWDLTETELHAAFQLIQVLPRDTLIKDFVKAATPEGIARLGQSSLPATLAEDLKHLVLKLERVPYAARWAALVKPAPQPASKRKRSHHSWPLRFAIA